MKIPNNNKKNNTYNVTYTASMQNQRNKRLT